MSLLERKYRIIEQLLKLEEESVLYKIERILNEQDDIEDIDREEILQMLLAKGVQQAEAGQGMPHDEVMAEFKRKFKLS